MPSFHISLVMSDSQVQKISHATHFMDVEASDSRAFELRELGLLVGRAHGRDDVSALRLANASGNVGIGQTTIQPLCAMRCRVHLVAGNETCS